MVCDFVGVYCYSEYVELATRDLYSKSSRTRFLIEWRKERKEKVVKEIQKYSLLISVTSTVLFYTEYERFKLYQHLSIKRKFIIIYNHYQKKNVPEKSTCLSRS